MKIIGLSACERIEHASNRILEYFLIRSGAPFEVLTLEGAMDFPDEGKIVLGFGGTKDEVTLAELLDKTAQADAVALATPTHYTRDGKRVWAFWETLFGKDSKWKNMLKGKPFVVLSIGGLEPQNAFDDAKDFLLSQKMDFFGGVVDNGLVDCASLCTPETCYVAKVVHEYGLGSEISLDIGSRIDYENEDIPPMCPAKVVTFPEIEELAHRLGNAVGAGSSRI